MKQVADTGLCALVVDDEEAMRSILTRILEMEGIRVLSAAYGQQAIQMIRTNTPDVVLLDVRMPGLNGIEVLKTIRQTNSHLPVVLITAYADIRQSVEAMKAGAYDYLLKPFANAEVARITFEALSDGRRRKRVEAKGGPAEPLSLFESMGPSEAIARVMADVHRVAHSDFSVLLIGETGAGKELVAAAIHRESARRDKPFITVDCGAIPEALLESELFGHEKGSFTGADRQKLGKFEVAHGGALFLDEIANLPSCSQAKLLRAIQSRTLCRVGGTQPIDVDFRLIAATNRNLRDMAATGAFREDLYYRLCDFTITIPPLRERKADILYLAKRFLEMAEDELGQKTKGLSEAAVTALIAHDWPGNVRELKSVIRRAALLAKEVITEKDLGIDRSATVVPVLAPVDGSVPWKGTSLRDIVRKSVGEVERKVLIGVLNVTGGNKAKAARLLQIDYKTMHTKAKKFGIRTNGDDGENT